MTYRDDLVAEALAAVRPEPGNRVNFVEVYGAAQEYLKARHGTGWPMREVKRVLRAAGVRVARDDRTPDVQWAFHVAVIEPPAPEAKREAPTLNARIRQALGGSG